MRTPIRFAQVTGIIEIRKSLSMTHKKKAMRLSLYVYNKLDIFMRSNFILEEKILSDIQKIKQVIQDYVAQAIIEYSELEEKRHDSLVFTGDDNKLYAGHTKEAIERKSEAIKEAVASFNYNDLKKEADTILPRTSISPEYVDKLNDKEKKIFFAELLKGESEVLHYDLERNEERLTAKRLQEEEQSTKTKQQLFSNFGVNSLSELVTLLNQSQPSNMANNLFSEKKEIFLTVEKKARSWTEKSYKKIAQSLRIFEKVCGDKDLSEYTREDFEKYRTILLKLPPNIEKTKAFENKTYIQIANENEKNNGSVISRSTVNTLIGWLSTFFEWCNIQDYVNKNLTIGLKVKDKRKPLKNRKPLDNDDLEIIREKLFTQTNQNKYIARLWVVLIGLYEGMRLEEIAQLHIEDIYQVQGIWIIDINENPNKHGEHIKHVKNQPSLRRIPIHPKLMEMGFIQYFEQVKKQGHERVFYQFPNGRDGFGRQTGDWFNRNIKRVLSNSDKKSFHSTRHTLIQRLKNVSADPHKLKAIVGHGEKDITYKVYGEEFWPVLLMEVISKVSYPQFDDIKLN